MDQTNLHQLNLLREEVPALFCVLIEIMQFEGTCRFLPHDVAAIVSRLLTIWRNLFENALRRRSSDYIEWEDRDEEHPSMFYPH